MTCTTDRRENTVRLAFRAGALKPYGNGKKLNAKLDSVVEIEFAVQP